MQPDRRALLPLGLIAAGVAAAPAPAAPLASVQYRLWPAGPPEPAPAGLRQTFGERSRDPAVLDRALRGVTAPFIEAWRPRRGANGASILIMPGGGYRYMAWDKEGPDIGRWFAARGVTAFVLAYRLPLEGWSRGVETPLADAQRAMRLIRQNAAAWNLDPERIAALGFSAGGHLTANLAARFDDAIHAPRDAIDRLSARPALAVPVYPAIKLDEIGAALFGSATDRATLAANSPNRHVPANAPPHFLLHAEDDPLVDPSHSLAMRAALVARKIPVETYLSASGGHGFGLRLDRSSALRAWPERVMAFGRSVGWLPA